MPEDPVIYGPDTGLSPCEAGCSAVPPLQDRAQADEADRETNNPNDDRREHALTVRAKSQRCCSWLALWDSFHTADPLLVREHPASAVLTKRNQQGQAQLVEATSKGYVV